MSPRSSSSVNDFLDREIYPALYARLDSAFPEFGFKRVGNLWRATNDSAVRSTFAGRADRVEVYANSPWQMTFHGGGYMRFLDYVNNGAQPTGAEFWRAVETLADKAGVKMPEREVTPEEAARIARTNAKRSALETVAELCRKTLLAPGGATARKYLEERGLDEKAQETLGVGLYPSPKEVVAETLKAAGLTVDEEMRAELLMDSMAGRVVFPWRDANGHLINLYGRTLGDEKPKYLSLKGGEKSAPLFFHRAKQLRNAQSLVLVEGVLDAAVAQVRGLTNVVCLGGASLAGSQLDNLLREGVKSITLCLDKDEAGEKGSIAAIKSISAKDINAFVAILPADTDPDEYILREGVDAWAKLIREADGGFRYLAKDMVARHKGDGWTDRGITECLDEAVAFDASMSVVGRLNDMELQFFPVIMEETGATFETLSVRLEASREKAEREREQRQYAELMREADGALREGDVSKAKELLRDGVDRLRVSERVSKAEPVRSLSDELPDVLARLEKTRGLDFIGLPTRALPKLDKMTLGLRGLILLAAAPNCGKTVLGIQFGLDIVEHNPDAAFLFVSLEMDRHTIYQRFLSRLSGVDWKTLVLGERRGAIVHGYTQAQHDAIKSATKKMAELGPRIRVLDENNFPAPSVEKIVAHVEALKAETGCSRVYVMVDYLQVYPVTSEASKTIKSDLDTDQWRIGQMKQLALAIGKQDPVLVISEARKPSGKEDGGWAGAMSDVMGSARGVYTPDIVILLNPASETELGTLAKATANGGEAKQVGGELRAAGVRLGQAATRLRIEKGRDGVERGEIELVFDFRQSRFEQKPFDELVSRFNLNREAYLEGRHDEDEEDFG